MKSFQLLALALAFSCAGASFGRPFDLGLQHLKLVKASENRLGAYGIGTALDAKNNYYVTGDFGLEAEFGTNILTSTNLANAYLAKYDSRDKCIWVRRVNNADAHSVATGPTGCVFVAGVIRGDTVFGTTPVKCRGKRDIFLTKYDSEGNLLWHKLAGGPGLQRVEAVAADAMGNSYITGALWSETTFDDIRLLAKGRCDLFVAKYSPEGKLLWVKRDEGVFTQPSSIVADRAGNVYVTGSFLGLTRFGAVTLTAKERSKMFLAKFDHDGNFLWVRCPDGGPPDEVRDPGGPPDHYSSGGPIVLDAFDNPLVAVGMHGTLAFGPTNLVFAKKAMPSAGMSFLVKYSAAGDFDWLREFRKSDFDLSDVVNVEASGVMLDQTRASRQSDRLASRQVLDSDAVKSALLRSKSRVTTSSDPGSLLSLEKSGAFILLFWAKNLRKVILEGSQTLSPFPVWESVGDKAEVVGDQKVVVIPMSMAMRFYRLRRS